MEIKKLAKYAGTVAVVLLMLFVIVGCSGVDQSVYDEVVADRDALKADKDDLTSEVDSMYTQAELDTAKETAMEGLYTQEELDAKLAEQAVEVVEAEAEAEVAEAEAELSGYLIDDVGLDGDFAERLDSDDYVKLSYSEVKFDRDEYDVEEVLVLSKDLKPVTNLEDKGGEVFLSVAEEGAVEYRVEFIDSVDFEGNCKDGICKKELVLNFLGEPISIVDFDGTDITLTKGLKSSVLEGEIKTIDLEGTLYEVQLTYIDEDDAKFVVNGEATGTMDVGDVYKLADDTEILLTEILYQPYAGGVHSAEFKLGDGVRVEVEGGDEYESDDRYEWVVEGDEKLEAIGLKLVETYEDEDEVFAVGEGFSLPEDYLSFTFDSVKNMDLKDLELEVDSDELELKFDGRVEVNDKRVDDGKITFELGEEGFVYEYEYKGEKFKDNDDLSEIVLSYGDREFDVGLVEGLITVGGFNFVFELGAKSQFVLSDGDASEMNDDEDFRLPNGDLLYKSDVNDIDDRERTVKVGLVSDEEVECVLKVV